MWGATALGAARDRFGVSDAETPVRGRVVTVRSPSEPLQLEPRPVISQWSRNHPDDNDMIRNVHTRAMRGDIAEAESILGELASPADKLWPRWRWPALLLDRGLQVGSRGGHGSVRYRVVEVEPRRVRFGFAPRSLLRGEHELSVRIAGQGTFRRPPGEGDEARPGWMNLEWQHRLDVAANLPDTVFRLVIQLHDVLAEDLLDQAERLLTGVEKEPRAMGARLGTIHRVYRALDRER